MAENEPPRMGAIPHPGFGSGRYALARRLHRVRMSRNIRNRDPPRNTAVTSLAQAIEIYGTRAYLVTVSDTGPHIAHIDVSLDGDTLAFGIGGTAVTNALKNNRVSVFWPPPDQGGYDIMLNGTLTMHGDDRALVTITKSVFFRPGPPASSQTSCTSDCLPLKV